MDIELKILGEHNRLPHYATTGAAGLDLRVVKDYHIYPGDTQEIGTGLSLHIGCRNRLSSYMGMLVPRSGLGTKGLVLANTIGIIDEDYQGEVIIQALNRSKERIDIKEGDRIAQLIFVPIEKANFLIVDEFSFETFRSSGGFGSTGE